MGARVVLLLGVLLLAGCVTPEMEPGDRPPSYQPLAGCCWLWNESTPLPLAVEGAACTTHNGEAWIAGGLDKYGFVSARVVRFDPVSATFTADTPLLEGVHHAAAVSIDGAFQVLGGYTGVARTDPTDLVQQRSVLGFYDSGELPGPLAEASVVRIQDRPFVTGGTEDGLTATGAILAWNEFPAMWRSVGDLQRVRAGALANPVNETHFAILGGWSEEKAIHVDGAVYDLSGAIVSEPEAVPTPRIGAASAGIGPLLFAIGGLGADGEVVDVVEYLDPEQGVWFEAQAVPTPVTDACAVTIGAEIHVFGGRGPSGTAVRDHWVLAPLL